MVEVADVVLCGSEAVCLMDDELGFIVEPLDGTVVDRQFEVVEDVVLVPTDYPMLLAQRFDPKKFALSGDPLPLVGQVEYNCPFSLHPDGERILVTLAADAGENQSLSLIVNWPELLR